MTTAKAYACNAYSLATAAPATADWRAVADALHAALCPRPAADTGAPRWFADWKLGRVYSLDSLAVRFADGVTVRCNLAKAPGKLPRIAAACRVAVAFYRAATGRDAVPAFASLTALSDGATFDAEACSGLTADLRRTAHVPAATARAVTPERIAWMRVEIARRESGLAVALADHAALMANPREAKAPVFVNGKPTESMARKSAARVAMWRQAAEAGAGELARMLGEAPAAGPVFIPRVRPLQVEAPDPAAGWCEAVADLYGQPAAYAVGETVEPDAAPEAMLLFAPTNEAAKSDTPASATPPFAGEGGPDDASHPVVALCMSERARAALFERIQDGTFPDAARTARGGAWRLTLADALDCQGIGSLRLVGLPRKPRVPRATPIIVPAPAARAVPVVEIRGVSAAAFYLRPAVPGLVVLHAPAVL